MYGIIGGFLIFTGIIGNALIIVYFGFKEKKRTSYNLFILLLAITDLVGSISYLAGLTHYVVGRWSFGSVACKLVAPLGSLCLGISSFLIMGMAYERCRGITKPLSVRKIKRKHVYLYFLFASIGWLVYRIPYLLAYDNCHDKCQIYSIYFFTPDQIMAYVVIEQVGKFIFPWILMSYFYYQIRKALQYRENSVQNTTALRHNKAALRTLRVLIISFMICVGVWSFFSMILYYVILYGTVRNGGTTLHVILSTVFQCFVFLNNVVNCFVYAGYMKDFRRFLKKLLCIR